MATIEKLLAYHSDPKIKACLTILINTLTVNREAERKST